MKEPATYSAEVKPLQVNVYGNAPRGPASKGQQNTQMPAQPVQPPMAMPYGVYPPPQAYFPGPYQQWFPGFHAPSPTGMPSYPGLPTPPVQNHIEVPKISDWLRYCDKHPGRWGDNLFALAGYKLEQEGYRRIDQLTRDHISVENLSSWLSIGKGTADLIIRYADEDMILVKVGQFSMTRNLHGVDQLESEGWAAEEDRSADGIETNYDF